ncbi:hypothetical protein PtB15_8B301 [Puccinia triticina]|nr:hypothetical protein PtB15_8B301 [Puccinia triticina]
MVSRRRAGFVIARGPGTRQRRSASPGTLASSIRMVERISNRRNQAPPPPPTSIAAPAPQDEWADENLNIYEAGEQENHADQTMRPAQPSSYVSDYARRRDQLVTAWKQLENSMTAAYFTCQHHTRNWTTSQMYLLPLTECTCAPQLVTTRELDLIHTHDRLSGQSFTFCKCIPDPIRLLHYGYIAASPTTPRTAFAIPTLQLYQSLWYESSLPYTSFSLDIYNRIQILRTEILGKTLGLTTQDRWAATCPSCFGPEAADEKGSNDEVYAIIAMDGNFQHRHHRYASKDVPMEADYPSNFIPPSQIDGHQQNEETTANNAQGLESPNQYTGENYTQIFLEEQWTKERDHYRNHKDDEADQAIELGKLLSLEDELRTAWSDIPRSPEDAISRLRSIRNMMDQIQEQREKLGSSEILEGISEEHQKAFLKMLYAKTELRRKHLALLEEKRPLDRVRMGRASKLGTRGKERLVKSLRKRAVALKAVLDKYNRARISYTRAFPHRPTPNWATERIEPILADPILNSLVNEDQLSFIKGILYTAFLEITSLQLVWEKDMTKIIQQTGPYENDDQLMDDWSNQVTRIAFLEQSGCLSMIEGDFDNTANAATTNNQEEQADEDDGTENVIGDEEEFERALEEEDLNAAFADSIHLR